MLILKCNAACLYVKKDILCECVLRLNIKSNRKTPTLNQLPTLFNVAAFVLWFA